MEMQKNREEIDSRYKWRLEDLFETDELWPVSYTHLTLPTT